MGVVRAAPRGGAAGLAKHHRKNGENSPSLLIRARGPRVFREGLPAFRWYMTCSCRGQLSHPTDHFRRPIMTPFTRILVPTDFSPAADQALARARGLAEAFGASLHLIHVFEDPFTAAAYAPEVFAALPPDYREAALADATRQLDERLGAEERRTFGSTTDVIVGLPAREIVRFAAAHDIDLIVMGTHGRGGLAHLLLGSVAERVVRTAPCAVLTVREPEHHDEKVETRRATVIV
jgi:nucleotide-binding universal stress UspA family protein